MFIIELISFVVSLISSSEMSVDSDRDSVIESEDDKGAVVRPLFSVSLYFLRFNPKSEFVFIYFSEFR